ncbi:hypothetical protein LCI18_000606 [Fusarium solani-melongenae]|uniref:Uncharacterized protein n=1 Tax=Fusarium solani subsp. cucurbitae TaxID=2747967 RepID=A0ACD3YLB6_FUSSC|nr:hypothetical protein LCI18_000606 [Fusarium solani-melongenae]
MDPLTSLSLTCAIVQLVDFGTKLIKGTTEIYGSATGATHEDSILNIHTRRLKDLTSDLKYGTSSPLGPLEKNLQELVGECEKLADQLFTYLEKTAAKDGSLVASATAAWNSLRYKSAKKDLQSQLDSCQDQLTLYLNALMRLMGKLHEGVHVTSLDGDIKNQLSELLGLSGRTYDSMRKHRILQSLSFDTMHRQIDEVHSAHVGTFDWILRDGSFVEWLSHGHGVFHIAGKPGSGKSTLMRFLSYDPRTTKRLEQWAAGCRVVRANYFFWRHGESDLQRNLEGLFRGLLHDSLSQCPDLIPDVLPELWEASKSWGMPWLTDSCLNLQKNQIRHAFYKMISKRDLYRDRRFCFFIDGLDEYKETTREDYGDLVKLLFEWVNLAPQDVKMCVSSRELTVFETGRFNLDPKLKLRLHQLTEKDIETLVIDRLSELFPSIEEEKSLDLSSLRQAVIARADGVFLWVTLVLKSLREGWADGDTLPLLLEKVNSTPPELDDLFRELLMSVAGANKQRAYLMMAVALRLNEVNWNMSALFCFFVTEFYTPGFANEKEDFLLDQSDKDERIATARRRIMAYSKGLLEVAEHPVKIVLENTGEILSENTGKVTFAHRSVCDFLKQGNIRNLIQEKVNSLDIHKAICLTYMHTEWPS